jgi:hypothetical protein
VTPGARQVFSRQEATGAHQHVPPPPPTPAPHTLRGAAHRLSCSHPEN